MKVLSVELCSSREYVKDSLPELKHMSKSDSTWGKDEVQTLCTHIATAFAPAADQAEAVGADKTASLNAKLHSAAALLRTQLFLQRYEDDIAGRPERVKEVANQW